MKFFVTEGSSVAGDLTYSERDYSFGFLVNTAERTSAVGELAYGNVVLQVGRVTGDVLGVWGYCPETSWEPARLASPVAEPARLRVEVAKIPPHGIAMGLVEDNELNTQRDPNTGWIRVGRIGVTPGEQFVEFATACLAELNGTDLVALWLRPRMHSGDATESTVRVTTADAEAGRMLVEALAPFRRMGYPELAKRAATDNWVRYEVGGKLGGRYNVQIHVTWDDSGGTTENVRVSATVNDGTVASVIRPLSACFVVAPDGRCIVD